MRVSLFKIVFSVLILFLTPFLFIEGALRCMYNFDTIIQRKNTLCQKWDGLTEAFGSADLLPLWVADTDFAVAPEILQALKGTLEHGILGYPIIPESAKQALCDWQKERHSFSIEPEDVTFAPGVIVGLILALEAFSKPGDAVIIQPPVYPPFFSLVKENNRKIITNPLLETPDGYRMDFEQLESIITPDVKLLILSNPHNPVGRVWTKEELLRLVDICSRNNIVILSDEIHQDIIYSGFRHIPTASVSTQAKQITVSFVAPSKTFNIPGLKASAALIPDASLRKQYQDEAKRLHLDQINLMGIVALEAAYAKGAPWLDALTAYLEKNRDFLVDFLKNRLPRVSVHSPEGSYLCWLDFRDYGLSGAELQNKLVNNAHVALNSGPSFGDQGEGFARINIGCPLSTLKEALERIATAFHS